MAKLLLVVSRKYCGRGGIVRRMGLPIWSLKVFAIAIWAPIIIHSTVTEQRLFSAGHETVRHPTPIPPGIMAILAHDPDVKEILESQHLASDKLPGSWFLASEVHLTNRGEKDLVIIGVGPIRGANVTTFWIFRPRDGAFESILDPPASVHTLTIRGTQSNGYKDIELLSATATTISSVLCKFEGTSYKQTVPTLTPIR